MSSEDAELQLSTWPQRARSLFKELLEDASSDLQRELLMRSVAAGHTPAEVHAFADQLRGLEDDQAYEACTLHEDAPQDYTMAQLLRAEADPLFAFELKGGLIDPNEDDGDQVTPGPAPAKAHVPVRELVDLIPARPAKQAVSDSFQGLSPVGARPKSLDWNDLSAGKPPPQPKREGIAASAKLIEALLAEATRALQISWKEQDVDVPGGLSMAEAISSAAGALARGIPVPCVVGPNPGEHRRFIVFMQLITTGKTRAFQLYDPFTSELLWVNETDLLVKSELPFANKMNRRLTRIVLPQSLRASF